jgi:hypothetical protein
MAPAETGQAPSLHKNNASLVMGWHFSATPHATSKRETTPAEIKLESKL